ncbi:MAG: hypothetical protein ACYC9T_17650 [Trichloromonadaceae bacterium]
MSEAVNYALKNVESSYEIHKSFEKMVEIVQKGMNQAISNSFISWFGDAWEMSSDLNLFEDNAIGVFPKSLAFKVDENEFESIQLMLEIEGDGSAWKLMGINTADETDVIFSHIFLTPLLKLGHGSEVINYFDDKYSKELREKGFIRKGNKRNPYYMMELSFSNRPLKNAFRLPVSLPG